MALKLITAPIVEPVSLADTKAHLRIDTGDDDVLLTGLIIAARQDAEKITRRALITQTWELVLDAFPAGILVPLPSLQSVTSIKYLDSDGVEQTLSNTLYLVDADSTPARIVPAYDQAWPSTRGQLNAVRIRYACGYGDNDTDIPAAIRQWIMVRVATLYENREAVNIGNTVTDFKFIDGLLDEYRVIGW